MPRKSTTTPATKAPTAAEQLAFALQLRTPHERSAHARERRYQAERDLLVAVLSKIWPSHIRSAARRTLVWTDVICIHSPAGQLAWGLPVDRAHWFAHLERVACTWDGHSAGERDSRLRALLRLEPGDLVNAPAHQSPGRRRTRRKRGTEGE